MFKRIFITFVISMLPFFIIFGLVVGIVVIIASGDIDEPTYNIEDFETFNLSESVLAYEPIIEIYAREHGIEDYISIIMAIMMQESNGEGNDPMQSSESYCGSVGCIDDPEVSIEQGIIYFKRALEFSEGDVLVAIQSYNFGIGFISWLRNHGGEYSLELATQFSQEMYAYAVDTGSDHLYSCRIGNASELGACYGDYLYVQHVLRYLNIDSSKGEFGIGQWRNPLPINMQITSPFRSSHRPDHNGVDFSCNRSYIPILAVDSGIVEEAMYGHENSGFYGYGNLVLIKHENSLYSLYAHLNEIHVSKGDEVTIGEQLGTCGETGNSQGIHLHLEARTVKMGGHLDPMTLLFDTFNHNDNDEDNANND